MLYQTFHVHFRSIPRLFKFSPRWFFGSSIFCLAMLVCPEHTFHATDSKFRITFVKSYKMTFWNIFTHNAHNVIFFYYYFTFFVWPLSKIMINAGTLPSLIQFFFQWPNEKTRSACTNSFRLFFYLYHSQQSTCFHLNIFLFCVAFCLLFYNLFVVCLPTCMFMGTKCFSECQYLFWFFFIVLVAQSSSL